MESKDSEYYMGNHDTLPTIITFKSHTNVITYANILTCHFPCNSLSPAIVDDITDGSLTNVDISMNFNGLIGSRPPIYTNKSFGVPGIKNNIGGLIYY